MKDFYLSIENPKTKYFLVQWYNTEKQLREESKKFLGEGWIILEAMQLKKVKDIILERG